MSQKLTEAQVQILADECGKDEQAYRDFVRDLTSDPQGYNLTNPVLFGLIEGLDRLTPASLELDHFKRAMTYGDKLRINPPSRRHPINYVVMAAATAIAEKQTLSPAQHQRLLLIHALLGKITEAMELAPILKALICDEEFDEKNLLEELGDDGFYGALAESALNFAPGFRNFANVLKLGSRYKGGRFTREEALNRDLDKENEQLGAALSQQ